MSGPKSILAAGLVLCVAALGEDKAAAEESPRFDYHTVRGRRAESATTGIYEGETSLTLQGTSRVQGMRGFGSGWSGDAHLLWDGVLGDSMETTFRVGQGGRFRLSIQLTKAPDYGSFSVTLNGREIHQSVDLYSPRVEPAQPLDSGEVTLKAGDQKLVFSLSSANARAKKFRGKGFLMGLDYLKLVRLDPPVENHNPKRERGTDDSDPSLARRPDIGFDDAKPLLAQYCYGCHGGKKPEGKIDFKKFASKADFLANIEITRKIAKVLQQHEMPPEDEEQPRKEERRQLASLFHALVDEYARTSGTLAPVVMRRLNRYEYNNAVRDLLGLKGDIYPLPERTIRADRSYFDPASGRFPDSIRVGNRSLGKFQVERQILKGVVPFSIDLAAEHGFNNRGSELSLSPLLLESFLKLGQSIVNSPQFEGYCGNYAAIFAAPPVDGKLSADRIRKRHLLVAEARIKSLLERAFRQPVDAHTLDRYTTFFARELDRSKSFPTSMKKLVSAVLASPKFLYLVERKSHLRSQEPLTDYELATRLSFFLWSSIPDEPLLKIAREGKLRDPKTLDAQVRRMLADRRCQALSESFARQWLRLNQLIAAVPDPDRFATYYSRIGCEQWKFGLQSMLEPLLLFESIMVEDRSIMLLVDSNYSYRSAELQSWYQDAKPFGGRGNVNRFNTNQQTFTRRRLTSRREGGAITTSAVLTMTSSPLRTNPITRGAWVAAVIFNDPPPPPPDLVPEIEADDAAIEAKGLTLRQRLKQHQVNQSCKACHAKIDPLGFALENYDAVGRWRDKYRSGLKIDASGKLFGEVQFTDVVGFKDAILSRPEKFMRAFSEHMLSYALGRELTVSDELVIDGIARRVQADRGQFSTVVLEVAKSYPFLHKINPADNRPSKKKPEPKP